MSNTTFNTAFDSINNTVEFKQSWSNGTGYYDNAVHDFEITEISKTTDPKNRKMILVPTPVGNVVVFERYTDGAHGIIVSNAPLAIEKMAYGLDLGTSLGEEELAFYLGDASGAPHIGERLGDFLNHVEFKKLYREQQAARKAAEAEQA